MPQSGRGDADRSGDRPPGAQPQQGQAIYILGQVYHSLGKAADAIREYRRVEDQFPDAKQSIEYFLRKDYRTARGRHAFKPGEPAEVELKFRNVAACDVKVYRIDLMKFSLLNRSLGGITQINLAGIRPHYEANDRPGRRQGLSRPDAEVALAIEGRGGVFGRLPRREPLCQRLVLVTPLAIEVQADAASGCVRTTVKDRIADKYLPDVHVKAIGSGNEDFVSGQTDLRGVFVADGIRGGATVIAQAGPSRYAFYRDKEAAIPLGGLPRTNAGRAVPNAAAPHAAATSRRPRRALTRSHGERYSAMDLAKRGPSDERIKQALNSPTEMEFVDTPLTDVIDYLKDYHQIEIQLDKKALEEASIALDTPVKKNLKGMSLKSALRLTLSELGLTYIIQDEVLLITTKEAAEQKLETVVYPVADLVLPANAPPGSEADFDALIDLITSTIDPTTWEAVGGTGSIAKFETNLSLTVSQTQEVHEKIVDVMTKLRQARGEAGGRALPMPRPQRQPSGGHAGGMGGGMGGMRGGMGGDAMPAPRAADPPPRSRSRPTCCKTSARRTARIRCSSRGNSTRRIRTAAAKAASRPAWGAGFSRPRPSCVYRVGRHAHACVVTAPTQRKGRRNCLPSRSANL